MDVEYRARDYGGVTVAEGTFSKVLAPGEPWACSIPLELKEAGPVWMEATARHRYGADYARICTGVLPPAPVRSGRESRMGIAAYRGTVGAHTEVRSERQLLELMRRIGVRQAADGGVPLGDTMPVSGDYTVGQRVEHPKFGVGIVQRIETLATDHKLVVAFDGAGEKTLLAKFAKLTKL